MFCFVSEALASPQFFAPATAFFEFLSAVTPGFIAVSKFPVLYFWACVSCHISCDKLSSGRFSIGWVWVGVLLLTVFFNHFEHSTISPLLAEVRFFLAVLDLSSSDSKGTRRGPHFIFSRLFSCGYPPS